MSGPAPDADPVCICDPFTDPDADNPACPNCHPEPSADGKPHAQPDTYDIADTAPDSAAERY